MKNNRQILATTDFLSRGTNKHVDPYRANCNARQSPTKSVRDRFSDDIQGSIHIGMNQPAVSGSEQTTMKTTAEILTLVTNPLPIEKGAFGGVALLLNDHLDAG